MPARRRAWRWHVRIERAKFQVGVRGLRGFELGFRLRDSFVGVDAGFVESSSEIQGLLIGDHSRVEQLLQFVLAASS